jgi:hypothetical protein
MAETRDFPRPVCALPQASIATRQRGCEAKKLRTLARDSRFSSSGAPVASAPYT